MENEPERPGVRFSFSPTIVSPSFTSYSVTADVPLFVTMNVVGPAGAVNAAGSHPASVMPTLSVRPVDEPEDGEPEPFVHPATSSARAQSGATIPGLRANEFMGGSPLNRPRASRPDG